MLELYGAFSLYRESIGRPPQSQLESLFTSIYIPKLSRAFVLKNHVPLTVVYSAWGPFRKTRKNVKKTDSNLRQALVVNLVI